MDYLKELFRRPGVRRIFLLAVLCLVFYLMRSLLPLFLLAFIFIILIDGAQKFLYRYLHRFLPHNRSPIVVFLYLLVLGVLVVVVWKYAPAIVKESTDVIQTVAFSIERYLKMPDSGNVFIDYLRNQAKNVKLSEYATNSSKYIIGVISSVGSFGFNFLMALILSLFFMLQKTRIRAFFSAFAGSKIGWMYHDLAYFGREFTNSFGKVLQTQILISFINSLFSLTILWILGFPNLMGLGIMIFLLGIIPVAGVFISLVPLSLIAYNVGGMRYVLYVVVLIAVLHTLEGYVLNPKLMSDKTKLPVFVTFMVLVVSEHFLGIWGLLVGIPIFIFLLDILGVDVEKIQFRRKPAAAAPAQPKQGGPSAGA